MIDEELAKTVATLSEEERRALIDQSLGWKHPGRIAQRWIAGILFALGSCWAVILVISLFLIVGIVPNMIFIFGWLIYGGWFFVMIGKRMSISLRFFWMASIVVHASYGFIFTGIAVSESSGKYLENGWAWWIPMALSIVALGCEISALRQMRDDGMICLEEEDGVEAS